MKTDSNDRLLAAEQLSALVDGELGDAHLLQACSQWRSDAGLRASWHAYQLIGDVLRSDDLGSPPGHDAAFLAKLRGRLADEPVVLAPQAAPPAVEPVAAEPRLRIRRGGWAPVAVAAGFVAVVGVVVATRFAPGVDAPSLASAARDPAVVATSARPQATAAVPATAREAGTRGLVASGELIRDVRLDRYLSAHKQFAGSSALGVPSGFLRNATADATDR